jgi:hypothetical protein
MDTKPTHLATANRPGEIWELNGNRIGGVHFRYECGDTPCVLHNPTDHSMRGFSLHWRDDRSIFERVCEHGIGHPDPDQFEYWKENEKSNRFVEAGWADAMMVHGCDGCCVTTNKREERP